MPRTRPRAAVLAVAAWCIVVTPTVGAGHEDGYYEQPLLFQWAIPDIDVLIVPPDKGPVASPSTQATGPPGQYLPTVERAIQDWNRALAQFGVDWLRSGLHINVYVLGRDTNIPAAALADPEILVVTDATKDTPASHIYGVSVGLVNPAAVEYCVADTSRIAWGAFDRRLDAYRFVSLPDMYNVVAHEYGHCLGLAHVDHGDISHDTMDGVPHHTAGNPATHLHCISNLNVRGVERAFAASLGQGGGWADGKQAVAEYATMPC